MEKRKLQWHPGFNAALRITLQDEMKYLEMYEEYLLSKKPPQIDVLIIKKIQDVTLHKAIGKIFRGHNIIEYKAPDDYLSINDFYKVYGYTCFYQSNTDRVKEIDPKDLTITFACGRYPRKLLRHLREVRNIEAEYRDNGIYYLKGDAIPMQLLITPELTQEENFWLQNLRLDLKAGPEIRNLLNHYEPHKNAKDYAAVMNLITHANWEQMEVENKVCDALKELLAEEIKEAGDKGLAEGIKRGHAEGMERGKAEGIRLAKLVLRLSAQGVSEEEIATKCGISAEEVRTILE